jgi:hypothetical protein
MSKQRHARKVHGPALMVRAQRRRIGNLMEACTQRDGLLTHQRATIDSLHRIIERAQKIAGRWSVLFPARKVNSPTLEPPQRFQLSGDASMDRIPMLSSGQARVTFTVHDLPTLVARVNKDKLRDAVHARLDFDGHAIAYAVSRETLDDLPRGSLRSVLLDEALPLMAAHLADEIQSARRPA